MTQAVAASWLVLRLTGSGFDLAVLSAAAMLPVTVGSLSAGALVDRVDRRRLLVGTQTALALLSAALFVLIATGTAAFWAIVLLSAAAGLVNAADGPARQVYVMDLVGRERLASAVGLYEVILNTSRVVGPALGGLLLAWLGPGACVLANALSFLAPLAVLLRLRRSSPAETASAHQRPARAGAALPAQAGATDAATGAIGATDEADAPAAASAFGSRRRTRTRTRGAARAGFHYAWSNPAIRACLLIAAAGGILFNSTILFPLLADRAFHLGPGGYGALLAAFGVGALPGALLAAHGHGEPRGAHVALLAAATGLCMTATALAPDPALLFLAMGATGLSSIWMIARANTLVQLRADPALRGRVMGAWTLALPGTSPATGLIVGALADWAGPRTAFAAAGLLLVGISAGTWRALTGGTARRAAEDQAPLRAANRFAAGVTRYDSRRAREYLAAWSPGGRRAATEKMEEDA